MKRRKQKRARKPKPLDTGAGGVNITCENYGWKMTCCKVREFCVGGSIVYGKAWGSSLRDAKAIASWFTRYIAYAEQECDAKKK